MNKGKLRKVTAIFFVFMLCFTVLSRAADQVGIAVVTTARPENKMITHEVKAAGKVVQNREIAVTTEADQRVKAIWVREGDRVAEGDVLFEIDTLLLEEKILEQQQEMEKQELQVKDAKSQKDVSAQQKASQQAQAGEQYALSAQRAGVQLSRAKQALLDAKQALKEFRQESGTGTADDSVEEALLKACGEKADAYILARQELTSLQWKIENAVNAALQNAENGAGPQKNESVRTQSAGEEGDILLEDGKADVQTGTASDGSAKTGRAAAESDFFSAGEIEIDIILPEESAGGNAGSGGSAVDGSTESFGVGNGGTVTGDNTGSGGAGSSGSMGSGSDTGSSSGAENNGSAGSSGGTVTGGRAGSSGSAENNGNAGSSGGIVTGDSAGSSGSAENSGSAGSGDGTGKGGSTGGGTVNGGSTGSGSSAGTAAWDDSLIIEEIAPSVSAPSVTQAELDQLEQSVRNSYRAQLQAAEQKVETALAEKEAAEAALVTYQQEHRTATEGEQAQTEKQLIAGVTAAQQAYEDAALAANEAAVTSGRAVQQAGIPDASNSSDRMNEITYEQMELRLQKLEQLQKDGGKVMAPADGLITKINIMTGEKTSDTTALLMTDLAQGCCFTAQLTKEQEQYIGTGDLVTLEDGRKQKLEELPVESVTADEADDSIYYVTVQIPEDTFEIGAAATLQFTKKSEAYPVCVPLSALHLDEKNQAYVLVPDEYESIMGTELRARRVGVTILEKNESYAAVSEGALSAQQEIIVSSDKAVDEGSRVRAAG